MVRVAVVGYGYWGPNLARNFVQADGADLVTVCDWQVDRLSAARLAYPWIQVTADYADVVADSAIDVVAIATPAATHYELAMFALRAGKHVLVEKPMALSGADAQNMAEEAERHERVLMVDHTFVYTSAVRKLRELVIDGSLGKLYCYDSVRVNLGLFQHDVNVLWDLAVHDVAIMDYVLGVQPIGVSAVGIAHITGQHEDLVYLTLFFEGGLLGHVHVSWLSPVKLRRTFLCGSQRMVLYDDLELSDPIKVYDRGVVVGSCDKNRHESLVHYRLGDMWAPRLDRTEALRSEIEHLLACIEDGEEPVSGPDAGARVVLVLEAAAQSMEKQGKLVKL